MATKERSANSFSFCGCFSRRYKMGALVVPEDISQIFDKYAGEHGVITAQGFQRFLELEQKEVVTVEEAQKLMDQTHAQLSPLHLLKVHSQGLNKDAFLDFLLNLQFNGAYSNVVHHDMSLPLSHYYVFTGHNSYLTGNQLNSDCSEVPIVAALKRGVRVIELDLWPDDDKTKVQVLHGGTLTKAVDFTKCIRAIKDHAFDASEYPVVITFEDHLTPELQQKAAEITTSILGDVLYIPGEDESFGSFHSPEELKRRILISTKPPKEYLEANTSDAKPEKPAGKNGKANGNGNSNKTKDGGHTEEEAWGEEVPDFEEEAVEGEKPPESSLLNTVDEDQQAEQITVPAYKHIISIRAGKPKGGSMRAALSVEGQVRRVSLSEPQLEKATKDYADLVIKFTQKNLLRIYPKGIRFDSSNYNPLVAWTHGAQMVAFNMQGYGRPLWLVHGFFRANGGSGYVKKPDFLLSPKGWTPRQPGPPKQIVKVKVYLGTGWYEKFSRRHFDNFSPPDFYTRVGIAGVKADTQMQKTKTIEDDWLPRWEEEFELPLSTPELALLRVEVHEYDMSDKDDFAGQTCIPVTELKPGIRALQLYDKRGFELTGVKLLVRFQFLHPGLPVSSVTG